MTAANVAEFVLARVTLVRTFEVLAVQIEVSGPAWRRQWQSGGRCRLPVVRREFSGPAGLLAGRQLSYVVHAGVGVEPLLPGRVDEV